jgi:hypothetical protein
MFDFGVLRVEYIEIKHVIHHFARLEIVSVSAWKFSARGKRDTTKGEKLIRMHSNEWEWMRMDGNGWEWMECPNSFSPLDTNTPCD